MDKLDTLIEVTAQCVELLLTRAEALAADQQERDGWQRTRRALIEAMGERQQERQHEENDE